jgi:bifunctional non-homologous end joining protein LigD
VTIAKRRARPAFVEPMTAKVVSALPEGEAWLYEVKLDGYRALIIKNGARVSVISRNEKDLTSAYPGVAAAGSRLKADTAVIDGEVVAVDATGHPSFQALQHRAGHRGHTIVFYAFDLLYLDGEDLTRLPLEDRRARLPAVLENSGILLSQELRGSAAQVAQAVSRLGLEGVIAKRRGSRYEAGQRTGSWVKLKLDRQQEFVVGGYRPGTRGVDALVVGYYEGKDLRYAGKVRAGFTPHVRRDVHAALVPVHAAVCPFADLPQSGTSHWGAGITRDQMHEFQWLKPQIVAQIRFVEWTTDGHLRHAAFLGLRTDKKPKDVRREA